MSRTLCEQLTKHTAAPTMLVSCRSWRGSGSARAGVRCKPIWTPRALVPRWACCGGVLRVMAQHGGSLHTNPTSKAPKTAESAGEGVCM